MKKVSKVKRQRVNWINILSKQDPDEMNRYFFKLMSRLHKSIKGRTMSCNRAAYCTLKHFYSTTTIKELLSKV